MNLNVRIARSVLALGRSAGGRSVPSRVYGVRASDPLVLASATLVVALISSVATALPARRASRVDPILALRGE